MDEIQYIFKANSGPKSIENQESTFAMPRFRQHNRSFERKVMPSLKIIFSSFKAHQFSYGKRKSVGYAALLIYPIWSLPPVRIEAELSYRGEVSPSLGCWLVLSTLTLLQENPLFLGKINFVHQLSRADKGGEQGKQLEKRENNNGSGTTVR